MTKMTRAEFYAKHGDVKVTFSEYYKFTFIYTASLPNGKRLAVSFGGNSDEIYRHCVSANNEKTVSELQLFAGAVYDGNDVVESFYDY